MQTNTLDASNCPAGIPGGQIIAALPKWYVVEAMDGAANRAHMALAVAGLHVWMPIDVKRMPRARTGQKRHDLKIPRFGRYFFIRCVMTDALQDAIKSSQSVRDLLKTCGTNHPAAVSQAHIDWLRDHKVADDKTAAAAPYVTNDLVRIVGEGNPFAGFEGLVTSVDKHGVLCVEINLFGGLTPSIFEARHVEMVQPAKSRAISTLKHRPQGKDLASAGAAA